MNSIVGKQNETTKNADKGRRTKTMDKKNKKRQTLFYTPSIFNSPYRLPIADWQLLATSSNLTEMNRNAKGLFFIAYSIAVACCALRKTQRPRHTTTILQNVETTNTFQISINLGPNAE